MGLVLRSLTLVVLFECVAHAQTSEKALAEGLFEDGRALLERGETARACERFAASQKIEPKIGTLLNLAACHEREGRSASAWAEFIEAGAQAARKDQPDRAAFARAHAESLGLSLSRVSFERRGGFEGVEVRVDGVRLERGAEGMALPVDPGPRTVEARAPGKQTWTARVVVPVGPASVRVDVPDLEPLPPVRDAPNRTVRRATVPPPRSREGSSKRTAGFIALTVGAVGSGLGTIYGVHAIAEKSAADRECSGAACSANGLAMHDATKRSATVATATFTLGAVGLALGAFLLLSGDEPSRSDRALAAFGTDGLALRF
ncbi:MAG TPA: hypothetical protein VHE30_19010 [Polyangiaceae bacterium]|nr:hypothetical protein [Polyangiaceae bacterium]